MIGRNIDPEAGIGSFGPEPRLIAVERIRSEGRRTGGQARRRIVDHEIGAARAIAGGIAQIGGGAAGQPVAGLGEPGDDIILRGAQWNGGAEQPRSLLLIVLAVDGVAQAAGDVEAVGARSRRRIRHMPHIGSGSTGSRDRFPRAAPQPRAISDAGGCRCVRGCRSRRPPTPSSACRSNPGGLPA